MNIISTNDAIISYAGFVEIIRKKNITEELKNKYKDFYKQYRQLKVSKSLELTMKDQTISGFLYLNIEQIWAYLHLNIEYITNHEINLSKEDTSSQTFWLLQEGLSKIWLSNPIENANYIYLATLKLE